MQLSPSFSLLFTSLLLALSFSFSNITDAKPLDFRKIITLPVKRYVRINITDVHPSIALQQHINHALSRLAHMNGSPHVSRDASGSVPLTVSKAAKAGKLSKQKSLRLVNYSPDISYHATIQIGTPPRDFSIVVDSGSADFWVGSEQCAIEEGGGCGNHVFLGPQSSSSFTNNGQAFKISFAFGDVSGTIIRDDISIANLILKGHTFGVATVQSKGLGFDQAPYDGLMGLGLPALSIQNTPTPVEALAKAGLIDAPIVSYKLSRAEDQQDDGEITFGGLDTTKFDPKTLVTLDNIDHYFWAAEVEGITIGSFKLRGGRAILDTGTTLALLPPDLVKDIHGLIAGAASDGKGGFTLPCDTSTVISLTFGNHAFDINPKDLTFAPSTDGKCVSSIASSAGIAPSGIDWILGATFLKNVYFSTNVESKTISLAKLV